MTTQSTKIPREKLLYEARHNLKNLQSPDDSLSTPPTNTFEQISADLNLVTSIDHTNKHSESKLLQNANRIFTATEYSPLDSCTKDLYQHVSHILSTKQGGSSYEREILKSILLVKLYEERKRKAENDFILALQQTCQNKNHASLQKPSSQADANSYKNAYTKFSSLLDQAVAANLLTEEQSKGFKKAGLQGPDQLQSSALIARNAIRATLENESKKIAVQKNVVAAAHKSLKEGRFNTTPSVLGYVPPLEEKKISIATPPEESTVIHAKSVPSDTILIVDSSATVIALVELGEARRLQLKKEKEEEPTTNGFKQNVVNRMIQLCEQNGIPSTVVQYIDPHFQLINSGAPWLSKSDAELVAMMREIYLRNNPLSVTSSERLEHLSGKAQ